MANRVWTSVDLEWLKQNYETLGLVKCAKHLNRTQSSILHKVCVLGIANRRGGDRKPREYLYGGYKCVSTIEGRYFVHRKVMEEKLGRRLRSDEIVHHIDGNKLNNDPNNLEITNRSDHMKIHKDDINKCRYKI